MWSRRRLSLDLALDFVANGVTSDDARSALAEIIMIDNPGKDATRKILVGLNRVWFNPPDYCRATRDAGVLLYRRVGIPQDRGRTNTAMPYWRPPPTDPYAGSPVKTPTLAYRSKGISNSSGAEDVVLVHALARKPEGSRCDSGPGVKHAEEMI